MSPELEQAVARWCDTRARKQRAFKAFQVAARNYEEAEVRLNELAEGEAKS